MNINFFTTRIGLFLILLAASSCNEQSKKYPAEVEGRITQVENSLAGWVQTGNR